MNRAVLAIRTLRDAIGSEWKHKSAGSNVTRIEGIDDREFFVQIRPTTGLPEQWDVLRFLREFKPVPPLEKVPSWYERLIADKLL